jgi:23S rRNA U2552 (ribose-2'-O)-methylase RlmE/FtsJ
MERNIEKPPWTHVQWYSGVVKPTAEDLQDCPKLGTWLEEENKSIDFLKESIHPYDKTELWDLAKRITNPYELINTFSNRLSLPKSTCCLHPLSRSFFKMVEMLHHLDFFDRHKHPKYKSMHICEGPGGFIEAFYHMADAKHKLIQASYAMTLKSTNAIIPGWRRATQFLQKNPTISILYGPTKTGDIYDPENQKACMEAVGQMGAHLVTSDGGFDFSEDFTNQEKNILRLLVSSSIVLLECVACEGDVVIKVFDCNSQVTRDLLYLLASCFQSWTLYKPVTSRPCNSEWYFIGKSAIRDRKNVIQLLKRVRDGLAKEVPEEYIRLVNYNPLEEKIQELKRERCEKQERSLNAVLEFCKKTTEINHATLWESQREATIKWCNYFRMPTQYRLSNG